MVEYYNYRPPIKGLSGHANAAFDINVGAHIAQREHDEGVAFCPVMRERSSPIAKGSQHLRSAANWLLRADEEEKKGTIPLGSTRSLIRLGQLALAQEELERGFATILTQEFYAYRPSADATNIWSWLRGADNYFRELLQGVTPETLKTAKECAIASLP